MHHRHRYPKLPDDLPSGKQHSGNNHAAAAVTDAPRKPFWRRKRWIAAAVLWLVVAYPLSLGPAFYCVGRGWLSDSDDIATAFYKPLVYVSTLTGQHDRIGEFGQWWFNLGERHAAAL